MQEGKEAKEARRGDVGEFAERSSPHSFLFLSLFGSKAYESFLTSSGLMTLPTALRGSSVMTMTCFGTL